jgi:hypothetical protein
MQLSMPSAGRHLGNGPPERQITKIYEKRHLLTIARAIASQMCKDGKDYMQIESEVRKVFQTEGVDINRFQLTEQIGGASFQIWLDDGSNGAAALQ